MKFAWAFLVLTALVVAVTVKAEDVKHEEIVLPEDTKIEDVDTKVDAIDTKRESRAVRHFGYTSPIGRMVNELNDEDVEALERAIRTRERIRRRQSNVKASNGNKRKSSKRKSTKKNKNKKSQGVKRRKPSSGNRRKSNKRKSSSINRKTRRPVRQQFYDDASDDDEVNHDDVNNDEVADDNLQTNSTKIDNEQNGDSFEEEVHRIQRVDGEPISVMIIEEEQ